MKLENLKLSEVIKRPSKECKTPYVADILIDDKEFLGHCPALGCCGLSDKGCKVYVSSIDSKDAKCQYKVELAILEENNQKVIIGINPKLAEKLINQMLLKNQCPFIDVISFKSEQKFLNSRFDFAGVDKQNRKFVLEIKNVPLADYVDVEKKERKKYDTKNIPFDEKIAYFPDGYRKKTTDVVSPRALKHIQELEQIANEYRAILCYVIQRPDVTIFQPSNIDLTYKKAVQQAWLKGVEIYAIQFVWDKLGQCDYKKLLPVVLFETFGPHLPSL